MQLSYYTVFLVINSFILFIFNPGSFNFKFAVLFIVTLSGLPTLTGQGATA